MTRKRLVLVVAVPLLLVGAALVTVWCFVISGGTERAAIRAMGGLLDLRPSEGEVRPEYDARPLPVDLRTEDLDTVLKQDGRSLFFLGFNSGQELHIDSDLFLLPNASLAEVRTEWSRVMNAKGRDLMRAPTEEEKAKDARTVSSFEGPGGKIYLKGGAYKPKPLCADGTVRLTVPVRFAKLVLPAAEIGKEIESAGLTAKLLHCENDYFDLTLQGVQEGRDPLIAALDGEGKRLRLGAGMTDRSKPFTVRRKAFGRVARIEVYYPLEFATRTLTVRATSEPEISGQESPSPAAPRYMADPGGPRFLRMTPAEVRSRTRIVARRSYAMFGFNTPEIAVLLPRMDNSAYAIVKFGEPQVLDRRGREVPHETEHGVYQHEDWSDEIRFTPPEGEGLLEFTRAVGKARISYPTEIEILAVTPQQPGRGDLRVRFRGPVVEYTGLEKKRFLDPFLPERLARFRAYDATGWRLRKLQHSGSRTVRGVTWRRLAFWGTVAEFRVVAVKAWTEFEIPFDLPPARKLPKFRIGTRPAEYDR